jgi:enoyl-[acyl-carrier protein] reductase III
MSRCGTPQRQEVRLPGERFALVTGSSRGIGRAVNETLARAGYTCVVHYRRDEEGAREAAESLKDLGARALLVRADLGEADEIESMFEMVRAEFGALDVFVANAASTALRPLLETEPRHAERTYRESVLNLILSLRRAAGLLRDEGRIVFVSGAQSRAVFPGYALLGPAKAAGEEIVKHLAVELGGRRITVNAVVPGFIETVSARRTLGAEYDTMADRMRRVIPVHRSGSPQDVADLVAFLASSRAGYITGQSIVIDGGIGVLGTAWVAASGLDVS